MSSSVFALSNRSEEFRRVDYLLKLSLRTSQVHDVAIWHFSHQHQAARFEERTQDLEVLHAWVDADTLGTSLDTLSTKGFTFTASGQRFITGTIPYDPIDDQTPYRFILCQIGVGRSFVKDDLIDDDNGDGVRLPDGYDSIFIATPQDDSSDSVYRHEYLLFDPLQALPMYMVQFTPGPENKRMLEWPGAQAPVESLYDRYDFFDPVWYVPVSVRDKMVGSHSTGEAAQHKLIGIADAYDAALNESLKPDPILTQRQNEIKSQLRQIDAKLRDVNRNSAEVEEKIYKAFQDALSQLQDFTQQKMNALLSEEVELRRQVQHIEWMESFLDRQRDEAEQVDFLNAWKCHVQLRGDLCRNPIRTSDVLRNIHADLEFEGSVRVLATSAMSFPDKVARGRTGTKRKQRIENDDFRASTPPSAGGRKGSGHMVMTGTPSPIQAASTTSMLYNDSSMPPTQPVQQRSVSPVAPLLSDAEVSRAFIEALRLQKEVGNGGKSNHFSSSSQLERMSELPPTPPAVRKPKKSQLAISRAPESLLQYSLSLEAQRKLKTIMNNHVPDPSLCFAHSRLVSSVPETYPSSEEKSDTTSEPVVQLSDAQKLFLTLPVHPRSQTELLYATWNVDVPSIEDLLKSMPKQQVLMDGEMVDVVEHCPTVLLIKANDRVFGGYASDSWRDNGEPFGSAKCFLFSIDNDVKIPFVGRELMQPGRSWIDYHKTHGLPLPRFASLVSDSHKMEFGAGDLVIANDFREGASSLESSFGIGLSDEDAQTFLAGGPRFVCDAVELWAIRS